MSGKRVCYERLSIRIPLLMEGIFYFAVIPSRLYILCLNIVS